MNTYKIINGCRMKYSSKYKVWVNERGTRAYREYKDITVNSFLEIHLRDNNSKFLILKPYGVVDLDIIVADCYKPKPNNGENYILVHKDGDIGNNKVSNLKWHKQGILRRVLKNGIEVDYHGNVYIRGNKVPFFDTKIGSVDDLMAEVGFVHGDKSLLKKPKVLHKDMDYLNFKYSNLEWVEEESQEYQDYKAKKKADIDELTKKLNPNKPLI